MSNPTFVQGPISYPAGEKLTKFRLVTLTDGKATHADATGNVFGAVTENADPSSNAAASTVAVHFGNEAVKLEVDGDATAINAGDAVFAAADGKASASGTVQVGVAAWDGAAGRVLTVLNQLPLTAN